MFNRISPKERKQLIAAGTGIAMLIGSWLVFAAYLLIGMLTMER
jgi:hypothetical protein